MHSKKSTERSKQPNYRVCYTGFVENKDPLQPHTHIEGLEKDLYSREFKSDVSPRIPLTHTETSPEKTWTPESTIQPPHEVVKEEKTKKSSFFKKILIISAFFFLFSASVAGFIFYDGLNLISVNKVDISFVGPVSIAAGDELTFDVVIHNQNHTALVNTFLYIDYPDGTKQVANLSEDLLHSKDSIGEVPSKTDIKHTVRAVLFGSQRSDKKIKVTLEYGLKASNGTFKKEKEYTVNISSTPLTMNIVHPPEASSGQDVSFAIDITSNSRVPLTNLALKADYPRGFIFKSADPAALDTSVWKIALLKPGEKKTITLQGKLEGEENDEKVFRFNIGINDTLNDKAIATSFLTASESIIVRRPALGAVLTFNNTTAQDSVVSPGQNIVGNIKLTNNLSEELVNLQAELVVSGNGVDFTSPRANGSLYRLPLRTLFWDKTTLPLFSALGPGQTASFTFSLTALPQSVLAGIKNGQINLVFKATATPINLGQRVSTETMRTTKVQPSFRIIPQIVYSTGPFTNTGPVPPKAEVKTTYTVTWRATYTTNEIANIEVHGSLPSYVKWLNVISPSDASLQWFPERNEIVWQAGTIPAGTVGLTAKEVSFQVEVYPSYSQIGTNPIVVDNIWFKARDAFTGVNLSAGGVNLTTPGKVTE